MAEEQSSGAADGATSGGRGWGFDASDSDTFGGSSFNYNAAPTQGAASGGFSFGAAASASAARNNPGNAAAGAAGRGFSFGALPASEAASEDGADGSSFSIGRRRNGADADPPMAAPVGVATRTDIEIIQAQIRDIRALLENTGRQITRTVTSMDRRSTRTTQLRM